MKWAKCTSEPSSFRVLEITPGIYSQAHATVYNHQIVIKSDQVVYFKLAPYHQQQWFVYA